MTTNSKVPFHLLFGNQSNELLHQFMHMDYPADLLGRINRRRGMLAVFHNSALVVVSGLRNAAIPLSGLTLLRWKQYTIGGIYASNMAVCI